MIICEVLFTNFRFLELYSSYFPNYLNIGIFIPNIKQLRLVLIFLMYLIFVLKTMSNVSCLKIIAIN